MLSLLAIVVIVLLVLLLHEFYLKRRGLPPGPLPLPFFGNLIEIQRHEPGYEAFLKWRRDYGPIYTYWLGTFPMICVADYDLIKETFVKDGDKYADRFHFQQMTKLYRGGSYGVVESDGDLWRDQRRFTLHTLRDFGMGKALMEDRVMDEVGALLERLASQQTDVLMQKEFDIAIGSVINNILFGYRFDEDKLDEFFFVKSAIVKQMKEFSDPRFLLIIIFPWLRYFPVFKDGWTRLFEYRDKLFNFFRKQIKDKEQSFKPGEDHASTFVECFLEEKAKKAGTPAAQYYDDVQIQNLVFDLWVAGMETTSNTLTWAVCYVLNDAGDVQRKIHEELDRVAPSGRKILLSDRNNLPYLNAVIAESQRLANLLPSNLFHATTEDVTINGHFIPKGSGIVPQISCVLYDEKIFPSPYTFRPERFISDDGSLRKIEQLIPFSVGKRQCVGEGLARVELFLFLANIFQKFRLSADAPPSTKKTFGQTVQAQEYFVRVSER